MWANKFVCYIAVKSFELLQEQCFMLWAVFFFLCSLCVWLLFQSLSNYEAAAAEQKKKNTNNKKKLWKKSFSSRVCTRFNISLEKVQDVNFYAFVFGFCYYINIYFLCLSVSETRHCIRRHWQQWTKDATLRKRSKIKRWKVYVK